MEPKELTFLHALCQVAHSDQSGVYEVLLSTGEKLRGQLSPLADDPACDHIRVNPEVSHDITGPQQGYAYFVALSHVVYFHKTGEVPVKK
jgi:hypothetical protein